MNDEFAICKKKLSNRATDIFTKEDHATKLTE